MEIPKNNYEKEKSTTTRLHVNTFYNYKKYTIITDEYLNKIRDEIKTTLVNTLFRSSGLNIKRENAEIYPTYGAINGIQISLEALKILSENRNKRLVLFSLIPQWYIPVNNRMFLLGGTMSDIPMMFKKMKNTYAWEILDSYSSLIKRYNDNKYIKALYIIIPGNPTGKILNKRELNKMFDISYDQNLYIIFDITYLGLSFNKEKEKTAFNIIAKYFNNNDIPIFICHSLSKLYGTVSLRTGFLVINNSMEKEIKEGIKYSINSSTMGSSILNLIVIYDFLKKFSQWANLINNVKAKLEENIRKIVVNLINLGYDVAIPDGSYYLFPRIPDSFNGRDIDFVKILRNKYKINVIPGSNFGSKTFEYLSSFFRISVANIIKEEEIEFLLNGLAEILKFKR